MGLPTQPGSPGVNSWSAEPSPDTKSGPESFGGIGPESELVRGLEVGLDPIGFEGVGRRSRSVWVGCILRFNPPRGFPPTPFSARGNPVRSLDKVRTNSPTPPGTTPGRNSRQSYGSPHRVFGIVGHETNTGLKADRALFLSMFSVTLWQNTIKEETYDVVKQPLV